MHIIADLHLHSKYSRATSPKMNVDFLAKAGKEKGLNLLGTGDFTHPKYLEELKSKLEFDEETGFYKKEGLFFVPTSEISFMYSQGGKGRKVHLVFIAPDLETVEQFNSELDKWGRRDYDGRPIFGKTVIEAVDLALSISKDIEVVPAHAWTPWFGVFGSKSGFDSLKEAFQDRVKHIHAIETGLSSDPEMNWRLSQLDDINLISNSDSHSPWSWRIGREATIFDVDNYKGLINAIRTGEGLLSTIEVDPAYGKYHWDGHRLCNFSCSPEEAEKLNNICPVCGKPLTIGVEHRVEELADRPVGFKPKGAKPFVKLLPLAELISHAYGISLSSKKVFVKTFELIKEFGSELSVLLDVPEMELKRVVDEKLVSYILLNREGGVKFKPGFDGEYGVPLFEEVKGTAQKKLGEF